MLAYSGSIPVLAYINLQIHIENSLDSCLLKHENNQLLFLGEENDCEGESSPPASFDESWKLIKDFSGTTENHSPESSSKRKKREIKEVSTSRDRSFLSKSSVVEFSVLLLKFSRSIII